MQLLSKVTLILTAIATFSSANPLPGKSAHGDHTESSNEDSTGGSHKDAYPMECKYPPKRFQQQVNHANPGLSFATQTIPDDDQTGQAATFTQRYQLIDEYFKPGGPILFYQGGEDPAGCVELMSIALYAMELGALVVSIEHRFFGDSVPGDLSHTDPANWTASALASLTLNNVLLDSVALVKHVKSTVPGAHQSKVIAFGGSYAGTLVALLRIHFPDVFFSALASSGVYKGIISDPHDPLVRGWANWVSQVIDDASPKVAANIRRAFQNLHTDGSGLAGQLEWTDTTVPKDATIPTLLMRYNNLVQFDVSGSPDRPFSEMIRDTASKDADDLVGVLSVVTSPTGAVASALSQSSSRRRKMHLDAGTTANAAYWYLTCAWLPWPRAPYPSADSIFGSSPPDYSLAALNDKECHALGFDSTLGGIGYQQQLGLDQDSLEKSTRIFFTLGTADPASSGGPSVFWNIENSDGSRVYPITGGAHCEEMQMVMEIDKASVKEARLVQLSTMKQWLSMEDLPDHYPDMASTENHKAYEETIIDVVEKMDESDLAVVRG